MNHKSIKMEDIKAIFELNIHVILTYFVGITLVSHSSQHLKLQLFHIKGFIVLAVEVFVV